ncbi:2-oxoglutarate dehydrogenase complex dihydrolipoyllysine-residue succinyltransferase [Paenibacillus crassostreae]|uniref:Dihydrolipoyllysine-residue succinyltransferase component of 2-oxoglutarate dehydrogenase complex n=1 Tax=Paenibacillus crassostreae TaxID=1763538 RepID=A0A167GHM4_9BACL|nr:2-oxoglutarate dehydrogenase complex dihydrolipoyllysine-residue succinyltransferase [Paenibacillus crassostreae]AOZ92123.1 dihydrolipoamide succinyltransferase [Paenibacillus crassostreae]OAB77584.1 dihydrolipoamide succinyltransferase [Paenibacillus crassostreae]
MNNIIVPAMGESITEGSIYKWHVKEGEAVKLGDILLELETDKVNLEISSEEDGVIEKILRQNGDTVQIGEVIGRVQSGGEAGIAAEVSTLGETVVDDKKQQQGIQEKKPASTKASEQEAVAEGASFLAASPSARKLARERGIELETVQERDTKGRIYQDNVRNHAETTPRNQSNQPVAGQEGSSGVSLPVPSTPVQSLSAKDIGTVSAKPTVREKMSRRRATIAKRLVEAQRTAAMLTTFNEVDMTAILDIRKRRKQAFQDKHDVTLGFMSFFTKAVVGALKAFPLLNAEIDGEDILIKKYYDIGIAVSAKEGLVVPVVRDADRLGFAEIERQIGELAGKARNNSLNISELQGGTFTITNGGIFGSLLSTPILNTPQVGILGMHKIQLRPIAIDQERMENRPMMYIALSYDHRIVDGSEAVRFLVAVKDLLEDPESLLLEG